MRRLLILAGLVLLAVVAGLLYLRLQPDPNADYVVEKKLQGDRGKGDIMWHAMPVDQAYARLGRTYTPFRPELSRLPPEEAAYIGALLGLVDAAVAERAAAEKALAEGRRPDAGGGNYPAILGGILALDTPAHLIPLEASVHAAVKAQRDLVRDLDARTLADGPDPEAPALRTLRAEIERARELLLTLYSGEDLYNKQAFQDTLVALDWR